ncbi:MAG: hypothetical protein LBH09_05180 [Peptococcaceae bacterium]|jgi:hypothetical protein|nr:hypothetical protein [Peptococcaceae bacterium]
MQFFKEHEMSREAADTADAEREAGAEQGAEAYASDYAAETDIAGQAANAAQSGYPMGEGSAVSAGHESAHGKTGAAAATASTTTTNMHAMEEARLSAEEAAAMAARRDTSKVMDALIEMLKRQSADEEAGKGEAGQVDKILHSLLSSPCNFTPLLHFVVPAYMDDVKAFAEIWINPYDDESGAQGVAAGRRIHILMVIDVEMLGRFEAELKVRDRVIDLSLHCPAGLEDKFSGMLITLPGIMRNLDTPYRLGRMAIETMDHQRSLMEVFKTLPYKRMGVDILI